MLIAILFLFAIAMFLMDAFTPDRLRIFPGVAKTPLGLASMALALLILSGRLHDLM